MATVDLLNAADFYEKPTLAGLQACVLMRVHILNRGRKAFYRAILASALTAARSLGLDRLGSALDDERRWSGEKDVTSLDLERDSSILPPQARVARLQARPFADGSHVLRETGRRVYLVLCRMDSFFSALSGHPASSNMPDDPGHSTAPPLNIDDESLSDDFSPLPHCLPPDVPSRLVSIVIGMGMNDFTLRLTDAAVHSGGYEAAVNLDRQLKEQVARTPPSLRLDGASEHLTSVVRLHQQRPYLRLHRIALMQYSYYYFLGLHRTFMVRGYFDPRYTNSTRTSIYAARSLVALARSLESDKSITGRTMFHGLLFHLCHGASVLVVYSLYQITCAGRDDEETLQVIEELDYVVQVLNAFLVGTSRSP